ncbi:MAG: phospho-N-acetylmuramoyl-pentapeptide-transferase [Candidatus Poribacteria bacterium]|nr:MAG: phospho-N-acetylmuramoyl-pentapeptide-transferase [Candidatus Poribacteria bacterium]
MLYHLLYEQLQPYFSPFRLFQQITFRAIYAAVLAFVLALVLGPRVIRWLQRLRFGQYVRREGLESHYKKEGTPTMGGVLILAAWLGSALLFVRWTNPLVWIAVGATIWFGLIGFLDDWQKIRKGRSLGLTGKQKLLLQFSGAAVIAWLLAHQETGNIAPTALVFPFFKFLKPELPVWLYVPFVMVIIVGAANAVNFTDGQDGLAIVSANYVAGTFGVFAYLTSHALIADYLDIPHIPETGELTIFCTALVGAGLGFLWWNAYPAEVFMGDTGSMALGGAIGTVAVATKQELLLPIVGGIFVVETLSVILQVWYFRRTGGKRIFRMAPLHHHFEKGGIPEPKVTVRFWIVGFVLVLIALSTLKLR